MIPRLVSPFDDSGSPIRPARSVGGGRVEPYSPPLGGQIGLRTRLARAVAREGAAAFAMRKATQAFDGLRERTTIRWLAWRPWVTDGRPVFLFINHRCGGGTEQHVRDLSKALYAEGVRVVVVRPSRRGSLVWEERDSRTRAYWCRESSLEQESMKRLLELLEPVHAHVHHVIGVPLALIDLLVEQDVSYDWTIHDYYTICPRVNLINGQRSYCGEPDEVGCNLCLTSLGDDQGRPVAQSIGDWRDGFARRLGHARQVIVANQDSRDRLARYFPNLSVLLRPHPESLPVLPSLAAVHVAGEPVRVVVVGTISAVKGSEILLACAHNARARGLALEFHVIGSTDRDAVFARLGNVRVSGRYRGAEVFERIAAARCHLAFLPSQCPESFMYTLSIVMAARLYTVCFDLGAQAIRLREWGWGRLLSLNTDAGVINDSLLTSAQAAAAATPVPSPPPPAKYADVLESFYNFSSAERERLFLKSRRIDQAVAADPHVAQRNVHARIH
jgi:glycosyltransferase involved in cell wall biosynthesis